VKAFSDDGSSKSLLVDERMNSGFVTKLLAGENDWVGIEKWWKREEVVEGCLKCRSFESRFRVIWQSSDLR
jgi:hypothetical protein